MSTKNSIQLTAIIILIVLVISLLFSSNANPDSIFFGVKRLQEKVFVTFKSDPKDKAEYLSALLDTRIKEFENIIKNESYSYMWSSSIRHSTFAGQMTETIISAHLTDMVEPAKKQLEEHKNKLNALYVAYPKNTSNVEWKYILDAINYLNAYLDMLSKLTS